MSDTSQGDGWWIASDGKWYAPELHPDYRPPPVQPLPPPPSLLPPPPQGPVDPQQVPPAKSHGRRLLLIPAAIVALIIIIIAATAGSNNQRTADKSTTITTPTTTKTPTSTTAPTPTTTAPTTTTAPPVPQVLWQQSGTGAASGPQFNVPADVKGWNEEWSYNCSAFGSSGNFITNINGYGSAAGTTDAGTNQIGSGGSGVNHYYDHGTFSIDVNSECSWTDEAVTVP